LRCSLFLLQLGVVLIMAPMAIPVFGGMAVALITLFVVPVLYASVVELQLKYNKSTQVIQTEN
jgi:membrane-bound ClpP family serine protease